MNNVILIGRITNEVDLRKTQNGKSVAGFALAVRRDKEHTDFIDCVAWNSNADFLKQYVSKGNQIGVQGSLQKRSYQDKSGRNVYVTEVIVNHIDLLESKRSNDYHADLKPQEDIYDNVDINITSSDLPF